MNGRTRESRPSSSTPATDRIIDSSSASSGVRGGRMPGRRRASMDLPTPGGPTKSRLWPPAAAISSARRAFSCPFTSARSRTTRRTSSSAGSGRGRAWRPVRWLTSDTIDSGAAMSAAPTTAASGPFGCGQISVRPVAAAWIAAGSTPGTAARRPSRPSSPMARVSAAASAGTTPISASRASAMGRSKCAPSFGISAGARFTTTRFGGIATPMAVSAARTRSRNSPTALSGRPTSWKPGAPGESWHWTSTSRASMPSKATLKHLETIDPRSFLERGRRGVRGG